jgi:hypothetical protein
MLLAPWTTVWQPATPPLRSHSLCTPQVPAVGLTDPVGRMLQGYTWDTEPCHFPATQEPRYHVMGILGLGISFVMVKGIIRSFIHSFIYLYMYVYISIYIYIYITILKFELRALACRTTT